MEKTTYQIPEIRDASDNIIQSGTYGKKTAFANATNNGVLDYINNNLEWLKTQTDANTSNLGKYLPLAGGTLTGDVIIDETTDRAIKGKISNVGLLYNSAAWALRDFGNGISPIYYNKSSKQLMFPTGYRVGGTVTDSTGAVTNGNTTLQINATDVTVKNSTSDPKITLGTGGASQSISSNGAVIKTGPLEAQSYSNIKTIQRGTAYSKGDIALSRKIAGYLYAECTTAGTTAALSGPTFTRASVAYDNSGNQVAAGVPRFTDDGLMIEGASANLHDGGTITKTEGANTTVNIAEITGSDDLPVQGARFFHVDTTSDGGTGDANYWWTGTERAMSSLGTTFAVGDVYACSAWVKIPKDGVAYSFSGSLNKSDWTGLIASSTHVTAVNDGEWHRYTYYLTITAAYSGTAIIDMFNFGYSNTTLTYYIGGHQIEKLSYSTSYMLPGTTRAAERLTIPASALPDSDITVEITAVFPAAQKSENYTLYGGYSSRIPVLIYIPSNNSILQTNFITPSGTKYLTIASNVLDGGTHKVAWTYSPSAKLLKFYLDGVLGTSISVPDGLNTTGTANIDIGSGGGTQLFWDNPIRDIRISNTAHTADKIASDAQLTSLPLEDDTTFLMPLNGDLSYLPALDPATVEPTYPTTANTAVTDGTAVFTLRDIRKPPNAVTDISYASGALTLTMGDGTTKTVSLS